MQALPPPSPKKIEEEKKCKSFMNLLGLARPVLKNRGFLDTDVKTPCGYNAAVFQGVLSYLGSEKRTGTGRRGFCLVS